MRCVDTIAMYMFYIFIIDFSLEMLDLVHRIYEADESFRSLNFMVHTRLYIPHVEQYIFIAALRSVTYCSFSPRGLSMTICRAPASRRLRTRYQGCCCLAAWHCMDRAPRACMKR